MPKGTNWYDEIMVLLVRTIGYGFWALCLGSFFVLTGDPRFFAVDILFTALVSGMILCCGMNNDDNDPLDYRKYGSNRLFVRPINTWIIMAGSMLYHEWLSPDWRWIAGTIVTTFLVGYILWQDSITPRWLRGSLALTGSFMAAIAVSFLPYLSGTVAYCLVTAGTISIAIAIWRWLKTTPASNPSPTS